MNSTAWRKQGFLIMNILLWTGELLMLSIREGSESEGLGSWSLFGITAVEGYSEVWRGRIPSVYIAYENPKGEEAEHAGMLLFILFIGASDGERKRFICLKWLYYSRQFSRRLYGILNAGMPIIVTHVVLLNKIFLIKVFYYYYYLEYILFWLKLPKA